jgi:hypothetical protein
MVEPFSANLGALYGPSFLRRLPASVYHADVNALHDIINFETFRPGQ